MARSLLIIILFPILSFAQNKDWEELQSKIDTAVKYNGIVSIDRNYVTDFPLIAAKWDSINNKYQPFTIQIQGRSRMWDVGGISQITYTGKDGFALGIHLGKGCVISGINFQGKYASPNITQSQFFQSEFSTYGDPTCRDKGYSPHAGLVIDPFRAVPPPDGGYPGLQKYYRGSYSNGGSTGFTIDNCTFNNFTIGLIFSPNGQTANCELMTVSNIRIYNTKAGIVGCQAQEKSMKLNNINCWGRTHTLFVWGPYGNGTPGHYTINGVQIAGGVVRLVNRVSGGYFPLTINDVFAEMLGSIGLWQSNVGDRLTNSSINFVAPDFAGAFPAYGNVYGQQNNTGILFDNCSFRYYGKPTVPLLFSGNYILTNCTFDQPPIIGQRPTVNTSYSLDFAGYTSNGVLTNPIAPGTSVVFIHPNSADFLGLGTIDIDSIKIKWISKNIIPGVTYGVRKYKRL